MADTMKAAVLHGVEDLRLEQRPIPRLERPEDVLIRIRAVGVCGSDIHYYRQGRIGDFVVEAPMILGHEAAGEVVEIGPEVANVKPGDRVAIEPGVPCRKCEACRTGRYNLCPDVVFMATPPVDGAFCEYVVMPWDYVFPLPEHLTFAEGAMMEPLSVGFHAARRGGVTVGDVVAVLGAGPIGICALQACRAFGATTVIITDPVPQRLDFARKMGATHTINAGSEDVAARVADITGGRGVDCVVECAGAPNTLALGLSLPRRGGSVVVVGLPAMDSLALPVGYVTRMELDVKGVFRYANCYPRALAAVAAGEVDVQSLVTHRYPLDQALDALLFADEHKSECMKVLVEN